VTAGRFFLRRARELLKDERVANTKRRVLVVDDDPDILESLQLLLEDTYEIELAENGHAALALLKKKHFDAMVLDLMMPVMSGQALISELAKAGIELPIIIASAVADLPRQAATLSVADAIAKPFDVDALENKLARVIALGGGGPTGSAGPASSGPISPRGGGRGASTRSSIPRVRHSLSCSP
jgi:CheY-like chemotaxis protein